jgi:putative tryptophan/tyrosine transport system substrate-binding protein
MSTTFIRRCSYEVNRNDCSSGKPIDKGSQRLVGDKPSNSPHTAAKSVNSAQIGQRPSGYATQGPAVAGYGDDNLERVPELAAELVRVPVDLIVSQGAADVLINKLDLPVPVVYAFSGDPVAAGFAESLARPHANMTGLTLMAPELTAKRLELLREMIPDLRRVAILFYPEHPGQDIERAYSEGTAQRLGIALTYFATSTSDDLHRALAAMAVEPPQAISLFADGFAVQNRERIFDFTTNRRIPVISGWPIFAESGALCTYGPDLAVSYRRLAYYVDRVLKGAKPAELPIEQPTKFELVLNLRSARKLGLTIPETILVRADRVIE